MRVSGHVIFVRPLVVPMALPAAKLDPEQADGAAESETADTNAEDIDRVKAVSAASDNYSNFFGQNLFFGAAGVALVVKNLADNGHQVSALTVAKLSIPMAVVALVFSVGPVHAPRPLAPPAGRAHLGAARARATP